MTTYEPGLHVSDEYSRNKLGLRLPLLLQLHELAGHRVHAHELHAGQDEQDVSLHDLIGLAKKMILPLTSF